MLLHESANKLIVTWKWLFEIITLPTIILQLIDPAPFHGGGGGGEEKKNGG
jgi:hypothetical protein